jgi:amino acid transporter
MIFAVLAYCGFDVVSTLAEETKMAHRLIPQATILSLFLYAGFIIFGIWALSYGGEPSHLKQVAERGADADLRGGGALLGARFALGYVDGNFGLSWSGHRDSRRRQPGAL